LRVLIDECLPVAARHLIAGHDVRTVEFMGWKGLKNGALLAAAEHEFDVIVTADKAMTVPTDSELSIVVVPSNRIRLLTPLAARIRGAVEAIKPGDRVVL
jgi:hypothetical protein